MVVCRYPETCGKTLEEIEEMFSPNGPYAWQTRKGESKLDALIQEAREKNLQVKDVGATATHHEQAAEVKTETA